MKKMFLFSLLLVMGLAMVLTGCEEIPALDAEPVVEQPVVQEPAAKYENGTYRGVFVDRGEFQVGVQFKLTDNVLSDLEFRQLHYGNVNYRTLQPGTLNFGVRQQYNAILLYLDGKTVDAINDVYSPATLGITDLDGSTAATIRANKVGSAIRDALNRGAYSPTDKANVWRNLGEYPDGRYRGMFADGANIQVGLEIDIENNKFKNITFYRLFYGGVDYRALKEGEPNFGIAQQYIDAINYLKGKPVNTVFDLHIPGNLGLKDADGKTGATIRGAKIVSAVVDGFNRGVYTPANVTALKKEMPSYADGRYRGFFAHGSEIQVAVEFTIENNVFKSLDFRQLFYKDVNYRTLKEGEKLYDVRQQYYGVLEYLKGKPLNAVYDLYSPGNLGLKDVDGSTGATIRGSKILSAIQDGLNRGIY